MFTLTYFYKIKSIQLNQSAIYLKGVSAPSELGLVVELSIATRRRDAFSSKSSCCGLKCSKYLIC